VRLEFYLTESMEQNEAYSATAAANSLEPGESISYKNYKMMRYMHNALTYKDSQSDNLLSTNSILTVDLTKERALELREARVVRGSLGPFGEVTRS
jgi:hypothetical protein